MSCQRFYRSAVIVGFVVLATVAAGPLGAQGPSGGQTDAINALLGSGVLGPAEPANPIADPAVADPAGGGTRTFQFSAGPNQGATETDVLKPAEPGAAAPWQYVAGNRTIYALATAADGSLVSPSSRICRKAC